MAPRRPKRPLAPHGADGRYSALTGRTGRNCAERLLRLFAVINAVSRSQVAYLFDLASDLDEQVSHMMTNLEEVQATLSQLTALYSDSLCHGGLDGDE